MDLSGSSKAKQIAQAAAAFEQRSTGRPPRSVTVVVSDDTLVITLHGTFSRAEATLAKTPEGAARLREFHRELFGTACQPLRHEIRKIVGADVREATAEVETTTGTVVQVFSLDHAVPPGTWSGKDLGPTLAEQGGHGGTQPPAI